MNNVMLAICLTTAGALLVATFFLYRWENRSRRLEQFYGRTINAHQRVNNVIHEAVNQMYAASGRRVPSWRRW